LTVTAKFEAVPPPQELEPATDIFPETAVASKFTVIEFVPLPLAIVAPVGSVHKYVVALVIAGTLYATALAPWHTVAVPAIVPAVTGILQPVVKVISFPLEVPPTFTPIIL
jgi:hypothetical protein